MAGLFHELGGSSFLTTQEVAVLKLKPKTREKRRVCGGGLERREQGHRLHGQIDDVTAWPDIHKREATANG